MAAYPAQDFQPIDSGKVQVEQHEPGKRRIRAASEKMVESLGAVAG